MPFGILALCSDSTVAVIEQEAGTVTEAVSVTSVMSSAPTRTELARAPVTIVVSYNAPVTVKSILLDVTPFLYSLFIILLYTNFS